MAKEHNFKLIPQSQRMNIRNNKQEQRWHCKDCDTIVQYPIQYTQHEVNHLVMGSRLACLPPVDNADKLGGADYYDKKYDKYKIKKAD